MSIFVDIQRIRSRAVSDLGSKLQMALFRVPMRIWIPFERHLFAFCNFMQATDFHK